MAEFKWDDYPTLETAKAGPTATPAPDQGAGFDWNAHPIVGNDKEAGVLVDKTSPYYHMPIAPTVDQLPQPSKGMYNQYDQFLKEAEASGIDPSKNPSAMAIGGMINNIAKGLTNPEALTGAVQDVTTFGQGQKISAPVNAYITKKFFGGGEDALAKENLRQNTQREDNPYLPFLVQGPVSEAQSLVKTEGIVPNYLKPGRMSKVGGELKDLAAELQAPAGPSTSGTGRVTKAIDKKIKNIEATQPPKEPGVLTEADILKDLSSDVGTPEGVAKRQTALMSPLAREAKNEKFFNQTQGTLKGIEENFKDFEKNVRFQEAEKNLAKVNPRPAKEAARGVAQEANGLVQQMSDEAEALLYDQKRVKFIDKHMRDMSEEIAASPDAFGVYKAVNKAKKEISALAKYGKNPDPSEKATINAVTSIQHKLDDILQDPKVFGKQAERHAAINDAYNKYITSLKNLQKKFSVDELTEAGRKSKELSSYRTATYSKQLDTLHGKDRRVALDKLITNAQKLSGEVATSGKTIGKNLSGVDKTLSEYLKAKEQFAKEMTLSNQLRRLRSNQGAENLANMGNVVQGAAENVAKQYIPGVDAIKQLATGNVSAKNNSQALIEQLLLREKQPSALGNAAKKGAAFGLDKLGEVLQKTPQVLGRFAEPLLKAAQRGGAAVSAANHVLQQQDPEYRALARKINGVDEPQKMEQQNGL